MKKSKSHWLRVRVEFDSPVTQSQAKSLASDYLTETQYDVMWWDDGHGPSRIKVGSFRADSTPS